MSKKSSTFAAQKFRKEIHAMNTLQLNAELYRNLGIIAEDETMMQKVVKYVRKLAKQMTDDPACMSKEEYFSMLDRSKEQAKRGKVYRFNDKEQMLTWLNSL